jgi:hypothetical protein
MPVGDGSRMCHRILRVRTKKDAFAVDDISVEYLKKNPSKLGHSIGGWFKDCAEITATSTELRDFVRENARNEAAWQGDGRVVRRRAPTSHQPAPPLSGPRGQSSPGR